LRPHRASDPTLDVTRTRDAQTELVRRYARIMRAAPAEAVRAWNPGPGPVAPGRFTRAPAREPGAQGLGAP
jgi:hypothetical protein